MTDVSDIVLIYMEDRPLTYARVEDILPDIKPNWYHVKLMILQFPIQVATWILKDAYINGEEFAMGGKRMRIERIVCPESMLDEDSENHEHEKENSVNGKNSGAKVIAFKGRKQSDPD